MKLDFKKLTKVAEEATPSPWTFHSNYPFYINVDKPASSLSKHDDTRPTYWRYEDGLFVATFQPEMVLKLLNRIEELEKNDNKS